MDYKNAGVDIEAGYKSVELMKEHVKKTMRPEVLGGLGGFSGAFSLAKIKEMEEPVQAHPEQRQADCIFKSLLLNLLKQLLLIRFQSQK